MGGRTGRQGAATIGLGPWRDEALAARARVRAAGGVVHAQRARRQPRRRSPSRSWCSTQTGSALATTALFVAAKFAARRSSRPLLTAGLDRGRVGRVAARALRPGGLALRGPGAARPAPSALPAVLPLAFADGLLALTARGLSRGAVAAVLGARRPRCARATRCSTSPSRSPARRARCSPGWSIHVGGVGLGAVARRRDRSSLVGLLLLATARAPARAAARARASAGGARLRDGLRYVRDHPTAGRLLAGEGVGDRLLHARHPDRGRLRQGDAGRRRASATALLLDGVGRRDPHRLGRVRPRADAPARSALLVLGCRRRPIGVGLRRPWPSSPTLLAACAGQRRRRRRATASSGSR